MFFRSLALAFALTLAVPAQGGEVTRSEQRVVVGDTTVRLQAYAHGEGPTFIRVHENETDAGIVGKRIVAELGGRFIDLVHRGSRDVAFTMGGSSYLIDPNRIFTREGIVRTLRASDRKDVAPAIAAVSVFAGAILDFIGEKRPLIALHNNRGAGYGLSSYERSSSIQSADGGTMVYRGATGGHNFFLVTVQEFFASFLRRDISVVYEPHGLNDGSLSYRYSKDGVAYINIETIFGQRELQMQLAREAAALMMQKSATVGGPPPSSQQ